MLARHSLIGIRTPIEQVTDTTGPRGYVQGSRPPLLGRPNLYRVVTHCCRADSPQMFNQREAV
jgi:hypothetical protein